MSKNHTTKANEIEQTKYKNVRYSYFGSRIEIDGVGYPVVAAVPFGRASRHLPTAEEKLLIFIE